MSFCWNPISRAWMPGALVLACALLAGEGAAAADTRIERPRVVTMTRWAKVFLDLEYDLVDAVRGNDAATLSRLLAEDFEQRAASQPGEPLPREAWLRETDVRAPGGMPLGALAVHDHGDVAIVSFQMQLDSNHSTYFVVDVWRKLGDDKFQLGTRYLSPVAPAAKARRKAPADTAARRPDGKG
jgi:ketosteroid isomerase-like protein